MQEQRLTIKVMSKEEVNIAVEWAALEGWNPGLHDAHSYYQADPHGFLIGYLGDEAVATISVVKYNSDFAFLGFYIVKPEYRGKGYGMQIWQAGLSYLKGCNIALDGVIEQQTNYKKSGFSFAYNNIRFAGIADGQLAKNDHIIELARLPFSAIADYEKPLFPAARADFLQSWISQANSHALGILDNDKLAGYGVIRACREGFKIGPLYANTPQLAESLFLALKASVPTGETIYLDVPNINQAAMALAQRYSMQPSFETARMYTQQPPTTPLSKVFGITSFEIG
ncbi:GNAT family N-acetyltransferase [Pseudoalteromonas sp. S1727]|uniref:GNAT family N-acetyltransferase n=1 Tax=Pseudoalteromonas sp. S1727 TaxID=2066514 RepID=UPI001108FD2C|nr:GNAT family N-acetyltransferase [Pseudoalteromonas sp. S1727]TMN72599.1 GNAT family N-acetyltransferase [Pseudoalteromonas sp. S1727]